MARGSARGDRKDPAVAAGIARRLLAAGRAEEALKAVDAAEHDDDGYPTRHRFACEDARIDALEAIGRSYEAPGAPVELFRAFPVGAPPPGVSEETSRFRRYGSRGKSPRPRPAVPQPDGRLVLPDRLAGPGQGRRAGDRTGVKPRRHLRPHPDPGRRRPGGQTPARRDPGPESHDRLCDRPETDDP